MERTAGTTVGRQAPIVRVLRGSKEDVTPKLESKIERAKLRNEGEETIYKVGNSSQLQAQPGLPWLGKGRTVGSSGTSHLGSGRWLGLP